MGNRMNWACAAAGIMCVGLGQTVSAAPATTKAFADFSYVWNFDGATTQENYDRYDNATGALDADGDGAAEWNQSFAPVSGAVSVTNTNFSNLFWTTGAAAAAQFNTTSGYTVEWRVLMNTPDRLLVESTLPGTTAAVTGTLNGTNLDIYFSLASTLGGVRTTVPADQFFTIRLAATPDAAKAGGLAYTLYINDLLIGDNINAERTTIATRRFFAGDIGGATSGRLTMDYAGFTVGPFAPTPVPEPTAACGLAGALGLLLMRRRRLDSTR